MNILDSKDINNRVKLSTIVTVAAVYVGLAATTMGIGLMLLIVAAVIASAIYNREISLATSEVNKFKKIFPLRSFGESYGDFEHVFYHNENIAKALIVAITNDLHKKANLTDVSNVNIVDVDPELRSPDERKFIRVDAGGTVRGTNVTLILRTSTSAGMQSIRWWALAGGFIDKDKKFGKVAFALFTLPFWILPYIKKDYDVLPGIRTIYPAYYNDMDVVTKIKCLHEIVFQAMVTELDKHDIDTSELRTQRMQVMNISVSGGKVNMGNIVQGGMNKISSTFKGANQ